MVVNEPTVFDPYNHAPGVRLMNDDDPKWTSPKLSNNIRIKGTPSGS